MQNRLQESKNNEGGNGKSTALVISFPCRDLSVLVNFIELTESSNRTSLNMNLAARPCSFKVYTVLCTLS